MRALTDAERALLLADAVEVTGGLEVLRPDLTVVEDISDHLEAGSVARNLNATIHGTCSLRLSRQLQWGLDLVRPYVVMSDGTTSARFNAGVFLLTTPERRVGDQPESYDVQGYDRLVLLNRQVGESYAVTAGTTYRDALEQVFAAAGLTRYLIEGSAADSVVPTHRVWSLVGISTDPDDTNTPVTWLRIVNDLLTAINFRAVWADEDGVLRCSAYQEPASRPVEFTFDADDPQTIVGEERTVVEDVWAMPNRWVFRWTNAPEATPLADRSYTRNLPDGHPMSAVNRGLVWTSVVDYEAASRAKLIDLGDRRVAADTRLTSRYSVTVGPFPCAGHSDVYAYRDSAAGVARKVQQVGYEIDLLGGDTRMTWEAV